MLLIFGKGSARLSLRQHLFHNRSSKYSLINPKIAELIFADFLTHYKN